MKKILKNCLLLTLFIICMIFTSNVYGATANISATKTTAYVGDTVTINVNINAAAWNLNVSGNGIAGGNITGFNMEGTNQITTKTYSLNTSSVGTYTIYLKGDISDGSTDATTDISTSVAVTVKAKPVTTPPTNTTTKPSTTNTTTKPQTNTATTNKNTSTTTTTLSSNAYLNQFRIDQPGITPSFNKTIYNYAVTVGEDVTNINVTAVPEHNKSTVTVMGNTDLKEGENTITVRVTAQDKKTVKTYKIVVTKTNDPIKSNAYLQNLIITNAALSPEFSSEVFEYDLGNINEEIDKLDISAFPVNQNAKVDIVGNSNLIIGENIIQVIVTSENGKIQKTYTLKVNKEEINSLIDVGDKKTKDKKEDNSVNTLSVMGRVLKENAPILLLYAFVWIEFIQVVYLYEKVERLKNKEGIKEEKISKAKFKDVNNTNNEKK